MPFTHTRSVLVTTAIDAEGARVQIDFLDFDEVRDTRVLEVGAGEYPFVAADVLLIVRDWLDRGEVPDDFVASPDVDGA